MVFEGLLETVRLLDLKSLLDSAVLSFGFFEVKLLNNLVQSSDQFHFVSDPAVHLVFQPQLLCFSFLVLFDLNKDLLLLSSNGLSLGLNPLQLNNLIIDFLLSFTDDDSSAFGFVQVRAPISLQSFFEKSKAVLLGPFLTDGLVVLAEISSCLLELLR